MSNCAKTNLMPKVFISHSTKEPDLSIAKYFKEKIEKCGLDTFFASETIKVGKVWVEEIEKALQSFEFFIVFLSENSKVSPMVANEIRMARQYYNSKKVEERPVIIPIRIDMEIKEGINYEVDSHLKDFQQEIIWTDKMNRDEILDEVLDVLKTKNHKVLSINEIGVQEKEKVYDYAIPTPAAPIEVPGGTCSINSKFYVIRKDKNRIPEQEFFDHLLTDGALLKIFAPRQFGKTSLLARLKNFAENNNHYTAAIDFEKVEKSILGNLQKLLVYICEQMACAVNLPEDEYCAEIKKLIDKRPDEPKNNCELFFQRFLLTKTDKPVVLMIDEADRLFNNTEISEEFFGLLRAWFGYSKAGKKEFDKLKIVVAYSTDARLAIPNQNQSPFANIPMEFNLVDFTEKEVVDLTKLHGLVLSVADIQNLMGMIGGHPFLVRKALYHLSKNHYTFKELIDFASSDDGAFADYLKNQFYNITINPVYEELIQRISDTKYSTDQKNCLKLKAAGLLKGDVPNVSLKYPILENYFKDKLKTIE
jgi:AAA-like domain/TIR domain